MSTNTTDEIEQKRKEFQDALEREKANSDGDTSPAVVVDTLKEEYDLDTLNSNSEIQAEIDTLQRRIDLMKGRTPEHAEELEDKKAALETLKNSLHSRSWRSVRQKLEDNL
ncbi:hypothetical protein [Halorubrum aethiopicum]|uniref:hypothetical protein n=1 Tax=Halorubrum aethiopicum TaxID=1758255 RepID=UPI00082ED3B1|nr:hypothetical protein [Halorubrum aethiopicum]